MKVEIEVFCNDTVKPSSPTPYLLQSQKLSCLDQIEPAMFMPLVLFYQADNNNNLSNSERSNKLKKSLSQALTLFYPLAGRLVDNSHINCNDEGVPYLEARANCKLSDILNDPIPGEMNKFLPYEMDDAKTLGLAIQISFFECGGMAVGIEMSHKVADGNSLSIFITSWAAISRGETDIPSPIFESANLFPPGDISGYNPAASMVKQQDKITKRFVFTASKIAELRENYANFDKNSRLPTRIEALSVFIWTRFIAATHSKDDPNKKIYVLSQTVNLRTRIEPPLSGHYFGNIFEAVITILSSGTNNNIDHEGCSIVNKLRETIRTVGTDHHLTNIREGKHLNLRKELSGKARNGEVMGLSFTSLCRFPLYEADFGRGKPTWISSVSFNVKNLVGFLDAQSGDGIEAWVSLEIEHMAKFEADKEILSFVSSN